jgi:hypothetical protein
MRKKKEIGLEEMTLKDFIAIFAMQAQIGNSHLMIAIQEKKITSKDVCGSCYEWADAMMEARNGN